MLPQTDLQQILNCPLESLPLSSEFLERCDLMGFRTLNEIVDKGWGNLSRMKHFRYRWFNELLNLLDEHQALDLLSDE